MSKVHAILKYFLKIKWIGTNGPDGMDEDLLPAGNTFFGGKN
jgi:hypothetical protein